MKQLLNKILVVLLILSLSINIYQFTSKPVPKQQENNVKVDIPFYKYMKVDSKLNDDSSNLSIDLTLNYDDMIERYVSSSYSYKDYYLQIYFGNKEVELRTDDQYPLSLENHQNIHIDIDVDQMDDDWKNYFSTPENIIPVIIIVNSETAHHVYTSNVVFE